MDSYREIENLIYTYAELIDAGNLEGMALLFAHAEFFGPDGKLAATGAEELEHFQQVYEVMRQRGIPLVKEISKDPYITALMKLLHSDSLRRFLDRLLLASIIECRGAERFRLVSEALDDDKGLQQFYHDLWVSEARHGHVFVGMALEYFEKDRVYSRLTELNEAEGRIVDGLELRAALH